MKKTLLALTLLTIGTPPISAWSSPRFVVAEKMSSVLPRGRIGKSGVAAARRAAKRRKGRK